MTTTRRTILLTVTLAALVALAGRSEARFQGFCSETAAALLTACRAEATSEKYLKKARCLNLAGEARDECFREREDAFAETREECEDQRDARLELCDTVGEARYDPDFDPALFDDPRSPTNLNSYLPIAVGNRWEYRGGDEVNTVEVLNESKRIAGVDCIVVQDLVTANGDLIEATDDWFAFAKEGSVWYCGEEVQNLESFEGDNPRKPELVNTDGSFKTGRNHDKPGILMLASPSVGDVYLEEFSPGNAEDAAVVVSTTYAFGQDAALDELVPRALVERLCANDCVVTENFSPLEPGTLERKYYARGIGTILEVKPEDGEVVSIVGCNFDPRCEGLPTP